MMVSGWSEYTSRRSYQIGDYISHQGDPGIEMYIVEKGSVAIIREEAGKPPFPLSSHSAGAMIGEIGLLQHAPRSASIIATEPTDILVLSRDDFFSAPTMASRRQCSTRSSTGCSPQTSAGLRPHSQSTAYMSAWVRSLRRTAHWPN